MKKQASFIFAVLLTISTGCSDASEKEEFEHIEQAWSGPPKPGLSCDYPMMDCGGDKCVNVQYDNKNCGWCETDCRISDGEFCRDYHCVNVRDFGYNIYPRGPKQYDVRRDLPRPHDDIYIEDTKDIK